MIRFDDKQIRLFENQLALYAGEAIPYATRHTLNQTARLAMEVSRNNVRRSMIQRNKWTISSIQFRRTTSLRIADQETRAGSVADYMADQEFGSVKRKESRLGLPIPTGAATSGGRSAKPRTRLPTRRNKLENISIKKSRRRKPKSDKQALLFKVQEAVHSGDRTFYHKLGNGTEGIFRVRGGRDTWHGRGWPPGAKIDLVYDLSRDQVNIPRNPWLAPSVKIVEKQIPRLYRKSLAFQARRRRLPGA